MNAFSELVDYARSANLTVSDGSGSLIDPVTIEGPSHFSPAILLYSQNGLRANLSYFSGRTGTLTDATVIRSLIDALIPIIEVTT